MAVRELGYRPFEGARRPPSANVWVLVRHGLRRAWASWLVKLGVILGWVPAVVALAVVGVRYGLVRLAGMSGAAPPAAEIGDLGVASAVRSLVDVQTWVFALAIGMGAGASAVSEDLAQKTLPFFFSKPVTPAQYLAGRVLAVASLCFSMLFVPMLLVVPPGAGMVEPALRLEVLGLLLPGLVQSALVAVVVAATSVGLSSLSSSRALTMSAFVLLFVVPHVLAVLVERLANVSALRFVSLPALLGAVADALFKHPSREVPPLAAFGVLVVIVVAALYGSHERLSRAPVIA